MSTRLLLLLAVTLSFAALTALALADVGFVGILAPHFQSWGGGQVLADLVIACTLAMIWMTVDSRTSGVSAWPFIVLTLAVGSFGPLLYLMARELRGRRTAHHTA